MDEDRIERLEKLLALNIETVQSLKSSIEFKPVKSQEGKTVQFYRDQRKARDERKMLTTK